MNSESYPETMSTDTPPPVPWWGQDPATGPNA